MEKKPMIIVAAVIILVGVLEGAMTVKHTRPKLPRMILEWELIGMTSLLGIANNYEVNGRRNCCPGTKPPTAGPKPGGKK